MTGTVNKQQKKAKSNKRTNDIIDKDKLSYLYANYSFYKYLQRECIFWSKPSCRRNFLLTVIKFVCLNGEYSLCVIRILIDRHVPGSHKYSIALGAVC